MTQSIVIPTPWCALAGLSWHPVNTTRQLVIRVLFLALVVAINTIVLSRVAYAPLWAAVGLALYLVAYFAAAEHFQRPRARRWLCGALLLIAFAAVIAISVIRVKYYVVAGASGAGSLAGYVAVFPLGD